MQIDPLNPFSATRGTVPSVVPFTIRENPSLLMLVEEMRKWIIEELTPLVNSNFSELSEKWNLKVSELIASWNKTVEDVNKSFDEKLVQIEATLNELSADLIATVDSKITASESKVELELLSLREYVLNSVQSIINSTIEVVDPVVKGLVSDDDSLTSKYLLSKYSKGLNAEYFGIINDGVTDNSKAIQDAIDYLTSMSVVDGKFIRGFSLTFEGGEYLVKDKIKLSPAVKIVSNNGLVRFICTVESGAQFQLTSENMPQVSQASLQKQQYFRGSFIDGSNGGIVFTYAGTGVATCLEIGSEVDLGALRPTSRYSSSDYAIERFDTAIKFNRFRNYIGSFSNVMLEFNRRQVLFGDEVTLNNVLDSGENITFSQCLFASGEVGLEWNCDGFDVNFHGCSFDYLKTIFLTHRSYKAISIFGGHIESFNSLFIDDTSNNASEVQIPLNMYGVTIYTNRGVKVKSKKSLVRLTMSEVDYRLQVINNYGEDYAFITTDSTVCRSTLKFTEQKTLTSFKNNEFINSGMEFSPVGIISNIITTPPIGFESVSREFLVQSEIEIVGEDSNLWGKCIKLQSDRPEGWIRFITNPVKCYPGEQFTFNIAQKHQNIVSLGLTLKIAFYNSSGTMLKEYDTGTVNTKVLENSKYQISPNSPVGIAPSGADHAKFIVTYSKFNVAPLYVTGLTINRV